MSTETQIVPDADVAELEADLASVAEGNHFGRDRDVVPLYWIAARDRLVGTCLRLLPRILARLRRQADDLTAARAELAVLRPLAVAVDKAQKLDDDPSAGHYLFEQACKDADAALAAYRAFMGERSGT